MALGALIAVTTSAVIGAATPPAAPAEISVLSYNVHGLPWPLSPGRGKDLKEIGAELEKLRLENRQPDIVLIQEGFAGSVGELIRRSGYRYWARGPARHDRAADSAGARPAVRYRRAGEGWGKFTGSGLYVLSDYPVLGVESRPYTTCAGWDCLANKGVMLARIAVAGVPGGIDVANTHLNSRHAARVPAAWSLKAYDQQVSQLQAFLVRHRDPDVPLLVGGDFNVRGAPDRYAQVVAAKTFAVVGESCMPNAAACEPAAAADARPWLKSQDLQAVANEGPAVLQPIRAETLFDAKATPRLSDHDGYLVRYRVRLSPGEPTRLSVLETGTGALRP